MRPILIAGIAIIGLVIVAATLFGAYYWLNSDRTSVPPMASQPSPNEQDAATPANTQDAALPTVTRTPRPTRTPTPTPMESPWVEGSVERASFDPAANLGPPDIHDDFSGSNPEFQLDNTGGSARGWYEDDRFNITFSRRGWWTWYSGNASLLNFYADVVVYNGDQCVDRDAAGLVYRYDKSSDFAFLFGVTCGGGYFSGWSGGEGSTGPVCQFLDTMPTGDVDFDCTGMWDHPTSPYIDPGPGAANRVGIRALGTQITLFVNGHQVSTVTIPSWLLYPGNFALYLGAGQADAASVSFDDFSIWYSP
jgi:hypothetical protein